MNLLSMGSCILGCARRPFLVLILGVVCCVGMSCGIAMLQITTDPIDLFTDPNGRARAEKQYFDEHLGPFFRTEMMIITPKNKDKVNR